MKWSDCFSELNLNQGCQTPFLEGQNPAQLDSTLIKHISDSTNQVI